MYPMHMNLTLVKIKQLDEFHTETDEDFRIAVNKKEYFKELVLEAQVVYNNKDLFGQSPTGDLNQSYGHLCFSRDYLDDEHVVLEKGDIVSEIDGVAVDYKFYEVRPGGFLGGGHNLILAYFKTNVDEIAK